MRLVNIFLSDGTAKAICWTLIHSVWQGILLAALAGVIIAGTRKWRVAVRYNLLVAALLLFLMMTGATFYYELSRGQHHSRAVATLLVAGKAVARAAAPIGHDIAGHLLKSDNFIHRGTSYLNAHAAFITLIWLTCLSVQLLRLTGGLYQLNRIRRSGVFTPGEYWTERLPVLAQRLGIKRMVTLLQSKWVKTPSAFGFFKPSILVPLGILANLPPDQVETILLHELAHIRRNDYAANLLMHLAEAIFFFNPGVRWVAALMRSEREACCDDMVLAGTPDKNSYFEALVAFTQLIVDEKTGGGSYALPLARSRTDLLWRVKRMLNQENKKLQAMEKAILSFGLMTLISICLISSARPNFSTHNAPKSSTAHIITARPIARTDTIPQGQEQHGVIAEKQVRLRSLSIDSKSEDGRVRYHAIATDSNGNQYEVRKKYEEVTEFKLNGELIPKEEYPRYSNLFDSIESARKSIPPPVAPVAPVSQVAPVMPQAPQAPGESVAPHEPVAPLVPVAPVAPTEHAPTLSYPLVYSNNPNPYVKRIILDLIRDGLIDRVDQLSFTLDANELIVNGTTQPDDIYQKFKAKYIRRQKDHFIYSQYYTPKGSGSHCETFIDTDGPVI